MKKLVIEDEQEGLLALLGERVTFYGINYIYTGKLVGVNETCVKIEDGGIVYETGAMDKKEWKDYQPFPNKYWYLQNSAFESFGVLK